MTDLFTELLAGELSQVEDINLSYCDLSSVEPALLQAVLSLSHCNLRDCDLSSEQLTLLLSAMLEEPDLRLKTLDINHNSSISTVEPGLIQALVRLEEFNLGDCRLTTEQLIVLFRSIQESADLKLKSLHITRYA